MRPILVFWLALTSVNSAITLEIFEVFRPISLHGTDVAEDFEGEVLQAKVFPQTMVFTGAQPEGLIAAIGSPHRLSGSSSYKVEEDNLLVLCGIGLSAQSKSNSLVVKFEISKLKIPDEIDLPVRTILKLAIVSVRETLKKFHSSEDAPLEVRIEIAGASKGTLPLKDLSQKFRVK